MIGDPHPKYPTLKVFKEGYDGRPTAYVPTVWYDWNDPKLLIIRNREGQVLKHHPNCIGECFCNSGKLDLLAVGTGIQSDLVPNRV
jgi:hypothetical protein